MLTVFPLGIRLLSDHNKPDNVERAFGDYDISVAVRHHIPYDATPGWNRPALEFLRFWIKPDHGVRFYRRLVVLDRAVEERYSIRL